jgi:general secretion pathway protein I
MRRSARAADLPQRCAPAARHARGFTLVEVLVALMIVAMGLAALMVAVSGAARTSGYLRDKTLAQWIALNRLTEVRLNSNNKFAQNTDTAAVDFAGRTWHYDTKYFDTSIATMKRVVVRVYAGDAKAKGNALAESTSFLGTALGAPGGSNTTWIQASAIPSGMAASNPTGAVGTPATTPGTLPATAPVASPGYTAVPNATGNQPLP